MRLVRFGVDGIRGIVGEWPFTQRGTQAVGCALGQFLLRMSGGSTGAPRVMIGRDTRPSGNLLVSSLKNGLLGQGVEVIDLGIMTTPGVAYLTRHARADLGVIVSASHNPLQYNGIKLVGPDGLRLRRGEEIEGLINELVHNVTRCDPNDGRQTDGQDLVDRYIQDQVDLFRRYPFRSRSLQGLRLVLDCANGAASRVAPQVLNLLGAEVIPINISGNGINDRCGSEHVRRYPQDLIEIVRRHGATYGFAFDGDGDRLVIVDQDGLLYNGDDFLFVLATYFHELQELRGETIVTTHMANTGLKKALGGLGIRTALTERGDSNLEAEIWSKNYLLGSEQVGNVIINDGHHAAADPLYAAAILSGITRDRGALRDLVSPLRKHPQVLASVHVAGMPPLEKIKPLQEQKRHALLALGKSSRVLAWYSGTERNLFKAVVEGSPGNTLAEVWSEAVAICRIVQRATGSEAQEPTVLDLSSRSRPMRALAG